MIVPGLHVGIPWQMGSEFAVRAVQILNLQTYCTWKLNAPLPMLWRCTADEVSSATVYQRNTLTLLGNEPEKQDQSNTLPVDFVAGVQAWQERYNSPIALPGILMHDAMGLQWLDEYLSVGGPIPDLWAIHTYAWSKDDWRAQWRKFQDWMFDRNVRRPVVITECASWGERLGEQIAIMDVIHEAVQNESRLVAAFWYSAHNATMGGSFTQWAKSDLLDTSGNLTSLGSHYLAITRQAADVYVPGVIA